MPVLEVSPPRAITESFGKKPDDFDSAIHTVRNMVTMAIGCVKELKSQAVEKYNAPGMRIIIGHILDLLAQVKQATNVRPSDLQVHFMKD